MMRFIHSHAASPPGADSATRQWDHQICIIIPPPQNPPTRPPSVIWRLFACCACVRVCPPRRSSSNQRPTDRPDRLTHACRRCLEGPNSATKRGGATGRVGGRRCESCQCPAWRNASAAFCSLGSARLLDREPQTTTRGAYLIRVFTCTRASAQSSFGRSLARPVTASPSPRHRPAPAPMAVVKCPTRRELQPKVPTCYFHGLCTCAL